jgi:hypothetical protein
MMNKSVVLGAVLWLGAAVGAMAQGTANDPKWKFPKNEKQEQIARAKVARYTDSKSRGEFRDAANNLSWLLKNTPDLNPSIYINGVEIYDKLAEKETDPAKQLIFQDSVMTLYDLRVKYFGDEAANADRKAIYAYKYFVSNPKRAKQLYEVVKKDADLNKGKIYWTVAPGLMASIYSNRANNPDLMTVEEVMQYYDYVNESYDNALADESLKNYTDNINSYRAYSDDLLYKILGDELDCSFIEEKFGSKLDESPNDVDVAKNLYKMLRLGKCTDSKYYLMSMETIYNDSPTFDVSYYLIQRYLSNGNNARVSELTNQAIDLAKTDADKAKVIMLKASLAASAGRKSEARSLYYEAASADASLASDAYSRIGNMYMNSTECYKQESRAKDRFIFLAAYDMYQKAGDSAGMNRAKSQFPSKEEVFDTDDVEVGQTVNTGCWIGANTVVRTRD